MTTAQSRLEDSLLYLVTPAFPKAGHLNEFLPAVLEAGVDIVQLREKDLEAGPLMRHCEVVRRRTLEFGALFIVNDRVDIAIAAGADGVHLGQDDLPAALARAMWPSGLIGLSTHSAGQLAASFDAPADYCAVGPIFETPTKPGRPAVGLELVRHSSRLSGRPIFAIGGINESNIGEVIEAGARRVCVVRALTEASDPPAAVRRLRGPLEAARAALNC